MPTPPTKRHAARKLTNEIQVLLAFWTRLSSVSQLTFIAKSKTQDEGGWNGQGKGEVKITRSGDNTILFSEKGSWQGKEQEQIDFSNVFRWTLDRAACIISLEHLRRGPDHPVFLFHLVPTSQNSLTPVDSHLCKGDTYLGKIFFDKDSLRLNWRVVGPKKNEELDYFYT